MKIGERRFSGWIIAMTMLFLLLIGSGIISYANDSTMPPPVTVNIDAPSHFEANLNFVDADDPGKNTPWCPGLAKKGSVRITNSYFGEVSVKKIDVEVANVDTLYNTFVTNMHLLVRDVQANQVLYNDILAGIAHRAGTTGGGLNIAQLLKRGGASELEFILSMLPEADDEMQGLEAQLAFQFNTEDSSDYSYDDSDDGSSDDGGGPPAPPFMMETKKWYEDCITALIAHSIIIPEIDGEIRPNDLITRGEAAVLVGRALGLTEDKESPPPYLDSIPDQYRGYVNATSKAKVFRGYPLISELLPGRVFKANNNITREELFCVLVRAYDVALEGDLEMTFTDIGDISPWARDDIKAGVQKKIIGGYPDNTLKPQQYISRAEAFTLICRLQGYHALHDVAVGGAGQ